MLQYTGLRFADKAYLLDLYKFSLRTRYATLPRAKNRLQKTRLLGVFFENVREANLSFFG